MDGGPALFRLVRYWSRRWAKGPDSAVTHILVVEAVQGGGEAAVGAVQGGGEATVGTVARQLGLDQSGASRMVRDAVDAGYLARAAPSHDRRQVVLRLTPEGETLLEASRQWQRATFDDLTATWSASDRHRFAGYLQRLADDLGV